MSSYVKQYSFGEIGALQFRTLWVPDAKNGHLRLTGHPTLTAICLLDKFQLPDTVVCDLDRSRVEIGMMACIPHCPHAGGWDGIVIERQGIA